MQNGFLVKHLKFLLFVMATLVFILYSYKVSNLGGEKQIFKGEIFVFKYNLSHFWGNL